MKKLFTLLIALTFVVTLATPKKSEAIVGGAIANAPTVYVGLALVVTGYVFVKKSDHASNPYKGMFQGLLGFASGFVGIIVLDEESDSLTFSKITEEVPGLDQKKIEIYNSEREDLDLVASQIAIETTDPEVAAFLWEEAKVDFSPETFEVLEAVFKDK